MVIRVVQQSTSHVPVQFFIAMAHSTRKPNYKCVCKMFSNTTHTSMGCPCKQEDID